jgi:hypothetical protein
MPDVSNPPGLTESGDVDHDETSNRTHAGDDLAPSTVDVATSITDPEGNTVTSLSDPVRVTEDAVTFAESDVTVTNNGTSVSGGSVKLINDNESTTDRPADSRGESGKTDIRGVEIKLNAPLKEIRISPSTSTSGVLAGYLLDRDGNTIDSDSLLGSSVTLTGNLNAGDRYVVGFDAAGSQYTSGVFRFPDYPYTGELLDITSGFIGGRINDTNVYNVNDIVGVTEPQPAGAAVIQWGSGVPADINSYDLVTYQKTLDGETVTVDVEDSNSNVLKSDISKNTDISDIATSTDVQLRANLSRNDTSNNPTLDYAARRFTR